MNKNFDQLYNDALSLLKELIAISSFSKEEEKTASVIARFFSHKGVHTQRYLNNVVAQNKYYDPNKPTLLLNSHHDTVKPNKGYTNNPFEPIIKDGKLFGLGSNDAGGPMVSLIATFLFYYDQQNLPYNIIMAATAEEEISGTGGVEMVLPYLGNIECAIVGEPTRMQMAIAERGLMVLDCVARGRAGHAARNEGENALYKAMADIEWMRNYKFSQTSALLGPVSMVVTSMDTANKQHNVVPDESRFIVDVRVNECYTLEDVLETIGRNIQSEITPRSVRMRSSVIPVQHPLVQTGLGMGRECYGSPTTSDKALMPFPTLKMGPGDSSRSHTADEYIYLDEIRQGIEGYCTLLQKFFATAI